MIRQKGDRRKFSASPNLVDAIIVVGGHNSGNTQRLSEIARQAGKPVYHIETESELDLDALSSAECVGITAGASTPNWIIKRVYRKLETLASQGRFRLAKSALSCSSDPCC